MLKFIGGLVLLLIGLWLLLPIPTGLPYQGFGWEQFLTVLIGIVPALLVFIGALVMWLEYEDLKIEREIKRKK